MEKHMTSLNSDESLKIEKKKGGPRDTAPRFVPAKLKLSTQE